MPIDEPQDARGVGAAVDEVADEDRLPALGVRGVDGRRRRRT